MDLKKMNKFEDFFLMAFGGMPGMITKDNQTLIRRLNLLIDGLALILIGLALFFAID